MRLFLAVLVLSLTACASTPKPPACEEVRGAFDIGSGSTKAYLATVDTCQNTIVKTEFSEQASIAFKDSLEESKDGNFPTSVIEEAKGKIQAWVDRMKEAGANKISAAATAAFRDAKNGEQAARLLSTPEVKVQIISQKDEARLGVRSALAQAPNREAPPHPVGIWDIGGGSMQMTYFDARHKGEIFQGQLASVNFKNQVMTRIQKKSQGSPNPLGANYKKAITLAEDHAKKHTPQSLKSSAPKTYWLGIGGVWWHSVRKQLDGAKVIRSQDLTKTLEARSKLKDRDIGGAYAATEVTNLALVLGYMKALNIEEVEPVEASLVQGLVLEEMN